ncbi:unnamed protein product [Calicophoron daubneyi]|uniref:Uncharacterized protein n=1 Tax=Calicophoron daubneyi TaxID=300641 RepID=A0AAV2TNB5_CALDB
MQQEPFRIRVHHRISVFRGRRGPIDRKAFMNRIVSGNRGHIHEHSPRGGFGRGHFSRGGPHRGGHGPRGPYPGPEGPPGHLKEPNAQGIQFAAPGRIPTSEVSALESDTKESTRVSDKCATKEIANAAEVTTGEIEEETAAETEYVKISKAELDLLLGEDSEDDEEVTLNVCACTLEDSAKNYVSEYLAENFETDNPSSSIVGMLEGLNSKFGKGWLLEISTVKDFDKKKAAPCSLFMFNLSDDTKCYAFYKLKS